METDGHKLEIKILYVIFRFMPNVFESDGCTGADQAVIVMVSKRLPEINLSLSCWLDSNTRFCCILSRTVVSNSRA